MLSQFVQELTHLVEQILLVFGLPGVVFIAFMENIFPPTPSEWLYPLAGKLAYDGKISPLAVIVAGGCGSLVGAFIFYHVGYYLGEVRVRHFIERYGTLKLWRFTLPIFTIENYERAARLFKKRGGMIVLFARSLPLVHGVISIPAGVFRMNLAKFMLYSFVGSALWITPTVMLGYFLGSQWERALDLLDAYETMWYIVIALVVLYFVLAWYYKRRASYAPDHL